MLDFDDLNTYLVLVSVAQKHGVDPSSSLEAEAFFRELLQQYPGSVDDDEEIVRWLDEQIQRHFLSFGSRPAWIQAPEWPFTNGMPMVFAGQIDISVKDLPFPFFHDDTSLYVFVGTKVVPVVVIQQY
jgi:hypothetical protein